MTESVWGVSALVLLVWSSLVRIGDCMSNCTCGDPSILSLQVQCPSSQLIFMQNAYFGRTSGICCPTSGPNPSDCTDQQVETAYYASLECNKKSSCNPPLPQTPGSCTNTGLWYSYVQYQCLSQYNLDGSPVTSIVLTSDDTTTVYTNISPSSYMTSLDYPVTRSQINKCAVNISSDTNLNIQILDLGAIATDQYSAAHCPYWLNISNGAIKSQYCAGTVWNVNTMVNIPAQVNSGVYTGQTVDIVFGKDANISSEGRVWLLLQATRIDGSPATNVNVSCGLNVPLLPPSTTTNAMTVPTTTTTTTTSLPTTTSTTTTPTTTTTTTTPTPTTTSRTTTTTTPTTTTRTTTTTPTTTTTTTSPTTTTRPTTTTSKTTTTQTTTTTTTTTTLKPTTTTTVLTTISSVLSTLLATTILNTGINTPPTSTLLPTSQIPATSGAIGSNTSSSSSQTSIFGLTTSFPSNGTENSNSTGANQSYNVVALAVGIGVGVGGAMLILFITFILLVCFCKKSRKNSKNPEELNTATAWTPNPESLARVETNNKSKITRAKSKGPVAHPVAASVNFVAEPIYSEIPDIQATVKSANIPVAAEGDALYRRQSASRVQSVVNTQSNISDDDKVSIILQRTLDRKDLEALGVKKHSQEGAPSGFEAPDYLLFFPNGRTRTKSKKPKSPSIFAKNPNAAAESNTDVIMNPLFDNGDIYMY